MLSGISSEVIAHKYFEYHFHVQRDDRSIFDDSL